MPGQAVVTFQHLLVNAPAKASLFYRNPRRLIDPPRFTPASTAGMPGAPAARGAINKAAQPLNIEHITHVTYF